MHRYLSARRVIGFYLLPTTVAYIRPKTIDKGVVLSVVS